MANAKDSTNLRNTGIKVVGDMPWGTHLCQFYQTKKDLLEILVPYSEIPCALGAGYFTKVNIISR